MPSTKIDSHLLSVGEVLKADVKYYVPPHQRNFAWTLEEVRQMWEDITSAMADEQQDYFLGTIVVQGDDESKTCVVIDGQQRLATLTMIFSAIRAIFEEEGNKRAEHFKDYLGTTDVRTMRTQARLTLNENNKADFQKLVVDICSDEDVLQNERDKFKSKSNLNLAKAVSFIRTSVRKLADSEGDHHTLFDLNDFVSDRVRIIRVTVSDEADAYLIFETLNDRGLDLTMSDLLKNYIFGRAGDQLDVAKRHWADVEIRLDDENLTQFLRHYWLSRYGVVRERDLYKSMKNRFSTQIAVLTLMEELVDAADKYAAISNVDHQLWKGLGTGLRRDLEALQLFGLSQFRPLMLAGLSELGSRALPDLVRLIVVLSMRYSIVGGLGTGNIERAYSNAALVLRESSDVTVSEIFDKLRPVYPDDDRFERDFSSLSIAKSKLARYVMRSLAGEAVNDDEALVNLEHVMPKKHSTDWLSAAEDEEDYKAHIHRLGNLTLIESSANSAAGNAPFSDKKEAFSGSEISMTKGLCNYSAWTTHNIHERQVELAEKAKQVWAWPQGQ